MKPTTTAATKIQNPITGRTVRIIRQRRAYDCAIAACAMALSISYSEAKKIIGDDYTPGRGTSIDRLYATLDCLGVSPQWAKPGAPVAGQSGIVTLDGHVCALIDGYLIDPWTKCTTKFTWAGTDELWDRAIFFGNGIF